MSGLVNTIVPDIIAPNLKVLFVGINPGLYTAKIGHHFGHPGNRFWKTLYLSGITPTLLTPYDNQKLLDLNYGIINLVDRPTSRADQLTAEEVRRGGERLKKKLLKYQPQWAVFLGVGAYKSSFGVEKVQVGLQEETIGQTKIWVLPNPSGLNANYPPEKLIKLFTDFRLASHIPSGSTD